MTDGDGNPISIWLAVLIRLLPIAFISILVGVASVVLDPLQKLINWDIPSAWIVCLLFGLLSLVWLTLRTPPFAKIINGRFVVPSTTNIHWSAQKVFAANLSKSQCLYAAIALILLAVLPFLGQSFGEYIDNKAGIVEVPVLYAIKDIPEGTTISEDELKLWKIPEKKVPSDALRSTDAASGHIAKYGIFAGQIISLHDITPSRAK